VVSDTQNQSSSSAENRNSVLFCKIMFAISLTQSHPGGQTQYTKDTCDGVARTKQNNEFSIMTFCYLLNCDYSFSLSFALFLHLNMCPRGSSNRINIASSTTNHSAYCIQWNRHLFGPKWGI